MEKRTDYKRAREIQAKPAGSINSEPVNKFSIESKKLMPDKVIRYYLAIEINKIHPYVVRHFA